MATVNILSAKLWTLGGIAMNAGIVSIGSLFPLQCYWRGLRPKKSHFRCLARFWSRAFNVGLDSSSCRTPTARKLWTAVRPGENA